MKGGGATSGELDCTTVPGTYPYSQCNTIIRMTTYPRAGRLAFGAIRDFKNPRRPAGWSACLLGKLDPEMRFHAQGPVARLTP
jgi:hypothetical protein